MKTQQFCTFFLDKLFFGVDVLQVQEVIRSQEMTRVPLADSVISGLINLRGQIVTAMDLRKRLNLPSKTIETEFMNVIVQTTDSPVSLLVDEIGDVLELDEELFESPPHHLNFGLQNMLEGVYKLENDLLLILNIEKTVDIDRV
ncbi:MAG: chemotaxis protein CheW [Candidatus Sericytochromatia bacterium]